MAYVLLACAVESSKNSETCCTSKRSVGLFVANERQELQRKEISDQCFAHFRLISWVATHLLSSLVLGSKAS